MSFQGITKINQITQSRGTSAQNTFRKPRTDMASLWYGFAHVGRDVPAYDTLWDKTDISSPLFAVPRPIWMDTEEQVGSL
jgi:hypothetical protein